jgi:hypothetical protein
MYEPFLLRSDPAVEKESFVPYPASNLYALPHQLQLTVTGTWNWNIYTSDPVLTLAPACNGIKLQYDLNGIGSHPINGVRNFTLTTPFITTPQSQTFTAFYVLMCTL